jgi:hypothetical protein
MFKRTRGTIVTMTEITSENSTRRKKGSIRKTVDMKGSMKSHSMFKKTRGKMMKEIMELERSQFKSIEQRKIAEMMIKVMIDKITVEKRGTKIEERNTTIEEGATIIEEGATRTTEILREKTEEKSMMTERDGEEEEKEEITSIENRILKENRMLKENLEVGEEVNEEAEVLIEVEEVAIEAVGVTIEEAEVVKEESEEVVVEVAFRTDACEECLMKYQTRPTSTSLRRKLRTRRKKLKEATRIKNMTTLTKMSSNGMRMKSLRMTTMRRWST